MGVGPVAPLLCQGRNVGTCTNQQCPWNPNHPLIGTAARTGRQLTGELGDILADNGKVTISEFEQVRTISAPGTWKDGRSGINTKTTYEQAIGMTNVI